MVRGVRTNEFESMLDGLSHLLSRPFITNEQRNDPNQKWKRRSSRASVINELAVAATATVADFFMLHAYISSGNFSSAGAIFYVFFSPDNKWQPISGKMSEICSR